MIQCFAPMTKETHFSTAPNPELRYACKVTQGKVLRALHRHEDILEIMLISQGKGNFVVGGNVYAVKAGDVIIMNAGVLHEEHSEKTSPLSYFSLGIMNFQRESLSPNHLVLPDSTPIYSLPEYLPFYRSLFSACYEQLYEGKPNAKSVVDALTEALLHHLIQTIGQGKPEEVMADPLVEQTKQYIEEHYQEHIALSDIAEALEISTYYLSRTFKERSGYSVNQYITHLRMGQAQNLLIHTNLTITEIAYQVGIESSSYFNSLFSKVVGIQPSKYRLSYRE